MPHDPPLNAAEVALLGRLEAEFVDASGPFSIESLREGLHGEFAPRADRALQKWPVTVSETTINGTSCQVVAPQNAPTTHSILHFFGGGYVSGCPAYDLPITAALACETQARVIAPRYPLAPEHPFPAALHTAIGIYREVCATLGDAPLTISGESAGGGLACAVVQFAMSNGLRTPDAMLLFSPWVDLSVPDSPVKDPTLDLETVEAFSKLYAGDTPLHDPRVSPLLGPIPSDWPPTYLSTAQYDYLRPMVEDLHQKLQAANVPCRYFDAPHGWHVFELYDELRQAALSLRAAADFVDQALTSSP
jgi:monoterpene epsilon-lactone hydrolase